MPYVTLDDANLKASTLAMGGGAIHLLSRPSPSGRPSRTASRRLAFRRDRPVHQFLQTAQTVIDTTDAINFTDLGATGPLFAMEVIART